MKRTWVWAEIDRCSGERSEKQEYFFHTQSYLKLLLNEKSHLLLVDGFLKCCGRYWIRTSDPLLVRQVL